MERFQAGRQNAVGHYEEMVKSVLEQFIRSDFPDSQILKTDAGEWELRQASDNGALYTDLKVQLNFDGDQPKTFVCVYYRHNGMHMRRAPLKREALARAVRKCISS